MAAAIRDIEFDGPQSEECARGVHLIAPPSPFDLPPILGLELLPRRLDADDEADLRWRFSSPEIATASGASSMGPSLERAESYGYGALPCRRCGGRWRRRVRRDGEVTIVGWRDGTGREPRKRFGKRETYAGALARYRVEQQRKHRIVVISRHADDPTLREATIKAFWDRGEQVVTPEELREMFPTLPESETRPCQSCGMIGVVPRRSATAGEVTA